MYYSSVMPVRIDTERVRESRGTFDPEVRTTTSGVMSMDSDTYSSDTDIPVSRGRRVVSVIPNPDGEGLLAEEKDFFYDDELGIDGQLTGFNLPPRRATLVNPGDTFATRIDRIVPGKPRETITTTFTVFPDSAAETQ